MSGAGTFFALIVSALLLVLPRRWALLPLLAGAFYMTIGQAIVLGPFHFTVLRILIAVGVVRVVLRKEWPRQGLVSNTLDRLLVAWGVVAICVSPLRAAPKDVFIGHLGLVYTTLGAYFLIRCFCRDTAEVKRAVLFIAVLLLPVALEMLNEQLTGHNFFSIFGGVPDIPQIRQDRLRSQGPFRHAILAGTVGAVCAPLMLGIWRDFPRAAKIGLAGCLVIVVTSASSGPLMSLIFAVFALLLWRWRHLTRQLRIAAVIGYIVLDMVMLAPAYYLIARIDVAGGSTGWHRARLIESSIEHFDEWWVAGSDYTRHWMPTGVSWSPDHADITNHYIMMGVTGGLLLMLIFIAKVWYGFRYVGESLKIRAQASKGEKFSIWCIGASLFAHAATCLSVSYFDQSVIFLYFNLAAISALRGPNKEADGLSKFAKC